MTISGGARRTRGLVSIGALVVGACVAPASVRPDTTLVDIAAGASPVTDDPVAAPRDRRERPLPSGTDVDEDRIADAVDECPQTPPETPVDVHGCAMFARVLDGVEFATGDHRLGAEARRALDRLIADLVAHPDVRIRLEGHTDNRGTAVSNLELSKERVMSVARYLVAGGVAPSRLNPYGYGESRPRAGNGSAAGRERNRRIEIGPPGSP